MTFWKECLLFDEKQVMRLWTCLFPHVSVTLFLVLFHMLFHSVVKLQYIFNILDSVSVQHKCISQTQGSITCYVVMITPCCMTQKDQDAFAHTHTYTNHSLGSPNKKIMCALLLCCVYKISE